MSPDKIIDDSLPATQAAKVKSRAFEDDVYSISSHVVSSSTTTSSSANDVSSSNGSEKVSDVKTVDDIIKCLGSGPFSYLALLAGGLSIMAQTVNLVGSDFTAPVIPFICADPLNGDNVYANNGTECFVSVNTTEDGWPGGNEEPCKSFIYDTSEFDTTVTSQFDLVCSRQFYRTFFQLIYTIGSLLGVIAGGLLCERFGRQRVLWYCMLSLVVVTLVQVFVPVLWVLLLARFVMGVQNMIGATAAFVLMMEVSPPNLRTVFGIVVALPYAIMMCLLAVIAYYIRNWKTITLLGSVPAFILAVIANPLILGESPRWLIIRGQLGEAERVIIKAAKLNRTTEHLPANLPDLFSKIRENEMKSSGTGTETLSQGLWSLVSSSPMRRLLLLMGGVQFAVGSIYIYIPLGANSVGSPFVYLFVMGLMELPAYSLTVPVAAKLGRRWAIAFCNFVGGALQMLLAVCLALNIDQDWLEIITTGLTYMLICSAFQIIQMFTSELYPTSVRTIGTSFILAMTNLGFCLPPMLDFVIPESLPWLPPLIYGCLAVIAAVFILFLPETNRAPLLETVTEYKQTYGKRKKDKEHRSTINK